MTRQGEDALRETVGRMNKEEVERLGAEFDGLRDMANTAIAIIQENIKLRDALDLAANRLNYCAVEHPTGSQRFYECSEWADEARRALSHKEAQDG